MYSLACLSSQGCPASSLHTLWAHLEISYFGMEEMFRICCKDKQIPGVVMGIYFAGDVFGNFKTATGPFLFVCFVFVSQGGIGKSILLAV